MYLTMTEPFSDRGALQLTNAKPLPRTALTERGAVGAADSRTVTRLDGWLVPTAVVATTLT